MINFTAVELLERPKSQRRSNDIKLRYHLRHTRLNFFTETELAREQERRNVFKSKQRMKKRKKKIEKERAKRTYV